MLFLPVMHAIVPDAPRLPAKLCAPNVLPLNMADRPPPAKPGYYKRPAAAVERGGGFYVPGLEGYKLRLAVSLVLSVGIVINRVLSPGEVAPSQITSELLGATSCILLLAQVVDERANEREAKEQALRTLAASRLEERKDICPKLSGAFAERASFAAATLLSLTPANLVLLIDMASSGRRSAASGDADRMPDGLLLRYGRSRAANVCPPQEILFTKLGGMDSAYLTDVDEAFMLAPSTASVVLQRCGTHDVLLLASDQPAFTDKQRLWISQVASLLRSRTA
eukprot:CAMPEP_0119337264 /NCGR_PEP_ID=MMETSP1333-20130426/93601_1 /TAXON_ID=418940 /ORGANISM="Scyphosphaera apsteinii, Strain RCC1455" /LENGTH=280 /DNA_ID=CAMNT_0007348271 /DNA_START=17 /DNA_END=859 /DNA_ORIENTATION=+